MDTSQTYDNKQLYVEGKRTVSVKTDKNGVRLLQNVYFVPSLAHKLLSVRQLLNASYSILFEYGVCIIKDIDSSLVIVYTSIAENIMFPNDFSHVENNVNRVLTIKTKTWVACGILDIDIKILMAWSC